ncbi:hypothetical protein ONZ51_g8656 [Trametes cubensis]|uniref:2-(3-amino-3-carboxypropyl)histidine synthase subunit 2 n=1 Tax=Trametes cubensis TaxID=1111947 RepID=A0AAD7X924_9APHY|nr:hypothetical protein ONZ51_g8656 [Trametes cubensis]
MAELTAFSSSGEEAITRTIELHEEVPTNLSPEELEDTFDIERTVKEIEKGDYKRVALQFPDELLPHSVPIFKALKAKIADGRELYVLADTSYGSCCVDEVAAQHVDADALVHYAHVRIQGHHDFRFAGTLAALEDPSRYKTVVLKYDVAYAHKIGDVIAELKKRIPAITILHTPVTLVQYPPSSGQQRNARPLEIATGDAQSDHEEGRTQIDASPEDSIILYIGGGSLTLTNLLLTHALYEVYSYDPTTRCCRAESGRTNKLLMRRYAVVQKARDADVIGILVGTLGVANYLPLIAHLRDIIKKAHKKSYTITVGKPNPAKLGNFLEIECFVLVACPENSMLDAKEFLRPIVTPYELEVALKPTQTWTGRYVLDFDQLLREHQAGSESAETAEEAEEEDLDQPVFSLITGKYRHAKRYGGGTEPTEANGSDSSAMILRNQEGALSKMEDSAAAQFLQSRTFRGLETRIGQDAPSILEQGRSGIARGYADDHREQS